MFATVAPSYSALDELLFVIDASCITPAFQPIVDLRHGIAAAFEILSRGPAPFRSPELLFDRAHEIGHMWELERACRVAALRAISGLPQSTRSSSLFFLNVSPDVIDDPRFVSGFTRAALEEHGISQTNVVIEITERASIRDYVKFEAVVRHYAQQGFHIALDDFGAGHNGLLTLISCVPDYLKLDMAVTRRIDREPYKQQIVRSMVALAQNVGAVLIAEGVETWEEAETLMRCGVEWAQGFLFGHPAPRPEALKPSISRRVARLSQNKRIVTMAAIAPPMRVPHMMSDR